MALLRRARASLRRVRSWVLPDDGRARAGPFALVAACATAAALLLALGDTVVRLDYALYDRLLRIATRQPAPPDDIVVVAIDEPSFGELGMEWPWPRRVHAALVDALASAGARAIVFDVVFDAPAADREDDELFADAMERAGNVILAVDRVEVRDRGYELAQWAVPLDVLARAAAGTGAGNVVQEPDGVVRRLLPGIDGRPGLALAALECACGLVDCRAPGAVGVLLDCSRQAVADATLRLLRFRGPSRRGITTVSYYQALSIGYDAGRTVHETGPPSDAAQRARDTAHEAPGTKHGAPGAADGLLPPGFFGGKTVFVGRALQSAPDASVDRFATPVDRSMPGVEIHATMFDALLRNRVVFDLADRFWPLVALLVLVAAVAAWLARRASAVSFALAAIAIAPVLLAGSYAALVRWDLRLPVMPPGLAFVVTGATVAAWRASLGTRQRRLIRRAFEHYVSPAIVAELLRDPSRLAVGGEEYDLSVLFADLEGFTAFSERLAPTEVRARLNALLEIMVAGVVSNRGTVDKLLGDGLVALFGCPVRDPAHAAQACRAALSMARRVDEVGLAWRQEGVAPPRIRIGISSGRAVAGNFGTPTVFQFTAVGDVVNTASRLEGVNRVYRTRILVGEPTARAAAGRFVLREIDLVRVKGRSSAQAVHELMAETAVAVGGNATSRATDCTGPLVHRQPAARVLALYADALAAYRARRWDEAHVLFTACLEASPDDGPAAVLRDRCERFRLVPPPKGWEGVFEMDTK